MSNKEWYQKTFSHVHSSVEIWWENYAEKYMEEGTLQKRHVPKKLVTVLIIAALLTLLCGTVMAVKWKELQDYLLPVENNGRFFRSLSLVGYADSPESLALAEWTTFQKNYDPDRSILHSVSGKTDESLKKYPTGYSVYTVEMAQELERIAEKYGLKLHTDFYDPWSNPEILQTVGDFLGTNRGGLRYMYEDGSLYAAGESALEGFGAVEFFLYRMVRGTLNDITVDIYADDYREWDYMTKDGLRVKLAMGYGDVWMFADLDDCVVTIMFLTGQGNDIGKAIAEKLVDSFNLALLTPVVAPGKLGADDKTANPPAAERTTAGQVFADVMQDFLNDGLLPDLTTVEVLPDASSEFAVCDVNGDGKDELILLYNAPVEEESKGFVISFSEEYTGSGAPVSVKLQDFPDLIFYTGGYAVVRQPGNQGLSGGVLQPYTLYCRRGSGYTIAAYVDAWSKEAHPTNDYGRLFPDELDGNGNGIIYKVMLTYASGVEPAGERDWDEPEYEEWIQGMEMGDVIEVTYLPLTEENIGTIK